MSRSRLTLRGALLLSPDPHDFELDLAARIASELIEEESDPQEHRQGAGRPQYTPGGLDLRVIDGGKAD